MDINELKKKLADRAKGITDNTDNPADALADALNLLADITADVSDLAAAPAESAPAEDTAAPVEVPEPATEPATPAEATPPPAPVAEETTNTAPALEGELVDAKGNATVQASTTGAVNLSRNPMSGTTEAPTTDTVKYSIDGQFSSDKEFYRSVRDGLTSIERSTRTGMHQQLFSYRLGNEPDLHGAQKEEERHDVIAKKMAAVNARTNQRISALANKSNDSLQFAGVGFCAPPTPIYEFCAVDPITGILDIPSFTMPPAGVRLPSEPDVSAFYSSLKCLSEAQEMARTDPKPCFSITCPEWNDITPCLLPMCISVDTIANWAFPQLTAKVLGETMRKYAQYINATNIAGIKSLAKPADFTGAGSRGTLNDVIDYVNKVASQWRTRYRIMNAPLRLVCPDFFAAALSSDASRRANTLDDFVNMTKSTFETIMARNNIEVAWTFDNQDAQADGSASGWGNETSYSTTYPGTVDLYLYAPDSIVSYSEEIVRVQGAREDTLSLRDNKQLVIFLETAHALVQRCKEVVDIKMNICNWGVNSIAQLDLEGDCPV